MSELIERKFDLSSPGRLPGRPGGKRRGCDQVIRNVRNEHDEQAAIIDWARRLEPQYPELGLLFAIPNGAKLPYIKDRRGRRYSPQAQKLKAEGLRAGVPDLCLPVARLGFHGMFIELKVGRNKPSAEQVKFLDTLADQGYYAAVCWGAEEAIREIRAYLEIGITH